MPTLTRFSPFLQVKDGAEKPPILIAHGLSGTVQIQKLARNIRTDHPVYGIQAKGIDGKDQPLDRVEDMAAFYLDALEEQFPDDAYILIGYSFGGLIALEMAQRLQEKGKCVARLVLVDTYPHPRFMSPFPRMRLFLRRMRIHVHNMRQMPASEAWSYFLAAVKRRLGLVKAFHESDPPRGADQESVLIRVNQKAYLAYTRYQPRFYRGTIKFVKTAKKTFFPAHPATVWKRLAVKLEVEAVPGDHLNIMTTHFESLATVLTQYVKEAECERR